MQDQVNRIEAKIDALASKLDSLDGKVDGHADRITRNEIDTQWVKGHIRIVVSLLIATVVGAVSYIIDILGK